VAKKLFNIIFLVTLFDFAYGQTDSVYTGNKQATKKIDTTQKKEREWIDKITYGGNLIFWPANPFIFWATPTVGYVPVKDLYVGIGFIYNYTQFDYGATYGKIKQSMYGGHSYARYFVLKGVYAQLQYDRLLQPDVYLPTGEIKKTWVDYFLVGGGFSNRLTDKVAFNTSILLNINPHRLSVYPNPNVVLGITVKL
jgi:hypothetical protein